MMLSNREQNYLISFILITYNRINDLIECVNLIRAQTYKRIEIILVDNASSDGTSDRISNEYPEIELIHSDVNLGVPGARNLAIEKAAGDILIFIDDDCLIKDNTFVSRLNDYFRENQETAVLSFKVINYYTNEINRLEFPHRDKTLINQPFETSYFLGGANATRREVFTTVGQLFSDYFYGFEELDFSCRALKYGYRIFYSPDFIIYHKTSPNARPTWARVYYFTRNRFWFVYSFLPWYFIVSHLVVWMTYFLIVSIKIRRVDKYTEGIIHGIKNLSNLKKRRKKLKLTTELKKRIIKLKGRMLY